MTNFDPDATPYCDSRNFTRDIKDWESIAKKMERRARVAEEKLRVAMEVLTTSCVYDYTDVQTALKEIYEVDP